MAWGTPGNLPQLGATSYQFVDAGFAASDVSRLSIAQTFALQQTLGNGAIAPNSKAYQTYLADGVTVVSLAKANASGNIQIGAENNCTYITIGGAANGVGAAALLVHYGGGIWFESSGTDQYGQDIPVITSDMANNILIGNSGLVGSEATSTDNNNIYFQVLAGKAQQWSEAGVTTLSLYQSVLGARIGFSTNPVFASVGGALFNDYIDAPSVHIDGATYDTLLTHTVPANALLRPGDKIISEEAHVLVASGTATREIQKFFGGTKTFDSGSITTSSLTNALIRQTIILEGPQTALSGSVTTPGASYNSTTPGPIVITSAAHGLVPGDTVTVTGVGGNTNANGTWIVSNTTLNTFTLLGSTGNAAWTSGGTWTSGGAVRVIAEALPASVGAPQYTRIPSLNLGNAQLLTTQAVAGGTGAAAGDITAKLQSIRYLPAAAFQSPPLSLFPVAGFDANVGTFQTFGGTPATANNNPVLGWLDQTPFGRPLIQVNGASAYAPLLKVNYQNGLAVVSFNYQLTGTISNVTSRAFLQNFFALVAPVSIYWVGGVVADLASTTNVYGLVNGQVFPLAGYYGWPGVNGPNYPGSTSVGFYTYQSCYNTPGGSNSTMSFNGGTKTTGLNPSNSAGMTGGVSMGDPALVNPGNFVVGEAWVFNRVLSTADENAMYSYLRYKWNHY